MSAMAGRQVPQPSWTAGSGGISPPDSPSDRTLDELAGETRYRAAHGFATATATESVAYWAPRAAGFGVAARPRLPDIVPNVARAAVSASRCFRPCLPSPRRQHRGLQRN